MSATVQNNIKKNWNKIYSSTPKTLEKMGRINCVASAFNTCIDSVIKISGNNLFEFIKKEKMTLSEIKQIDKKSIQSVKDLLKGIFRCFVNGIAEEWTADKVEIFDWMLNNLGTKKMQMGGQAGIIANTLALTDIKNVIVHSNALSKLQAEQFTKKPNLLSFDKNGNLTQASTIDRDKHSSIHWIVEFDKNDKISLDGQYFICPKSNRFIATYDPPLFNFVIDKNFTEYTKSNKVDYFVLSGYQALNSKNSGIKYVKNSLPIIHAWKKKSSKSVVHLEIASTQDIKVRKAITKYIVPNVDSIGINERETMDILEVIGQKYLLKQCQENTDSVNLFKSVLKIKQKLGCPRIQMHMLGLYITIQNKNFRLSPKANRNGMTLAATAAASKAYLGQLSKKEDILTAQSFSVSYKGLSELKKLSNYLKKEDLLTKGITEYQNFDIIAVPTILVEKPKTLVGMGDTISSFSLIGAR